MQIDFVSVNVLLVVFDYKQRDCNPIVKFPALEDLI